LENYLITHRTVAKDGNCMILPHASTCRGLVSVRWLCLNLDLKFKQTGRKNALMFM